MKSHSRFFSWLLTCLTIVNLSHLSLTSADLTEEQKAKLNELIDWKVVLKDNPEATVRAGAAFARSLLPRLGLMTNVAATRALMQLSVGGSPPPLRPEWNEQSSEFKGLSQDDQELVRASKKASDDIQAFRNSFTHYFHSKWNQHHESACAKTATHEPATQAAALSELVSKALTSQVASVAQSLYLSRANRPPTITNGDAMSEVPNQSMIEGFEVVPSGDLTWFRGNAEQGYGSTVNNKVMQSLLNPVLRSMPAYRVNQAPVLLENSEECRQFFKTLPSDELKDRLTEKEGFVTVAYRYELNPAGLVPLSSCAPAPPTARARASDIVRYHRAVAEFETQSLPKTFFLFMQIPKPTEGALSAMRLTPKRASELEKRLAIERLRQAAFQTALNAGDINALNKLAQDGHPGAQWEYAYRIRNLPGRAAESQALLAKARAQGLPDFEVRQDPVLDVTESWRALRRIDATQAELNRRVQRRNQDILDGILRLAGPGERQVYQAGGAVDQVERVGPARPATPGPADAETAALRQAAHAALGNRLAQQPAVAAPAPNRAGYGQLQRELVDQSYEQALGQVHYVGAEPPLVDRHGMVFGPALPADTPDEGIPLAELVRRLGPGVRLPTEEEVAFLRREGRQMRERVERGEVPVVFPRPSAPPSPLPADDDLY